MNVNRSKSILTMPLKLIMVLSAAMSISTGAFAQGTAMQYLKSTPASLYDIGMMRLYRKLGDIHSYGKAVGWGAKLGPFSLLHPFFSEDGPKILVLISGQDFPDREAAVSVCKTAFSKIKDFGGVNEDGTLMNRQVGQTSFSRLFFPRDFDDWPTNYKEIAHDLNKSIKLRCEAGLLFETNQFTTIILETNFWSNKVYEVLD